MGGSSAALGLGDAGTAALTLNGRGIRASRKLRWRAAPLDTTANGAFVRDGRNCVHVARVQSWPQARRGAGPSRSRAAHVGGVSGSAASYMGGRSARRHLGDI